MNIVNYIVRVLFLSSMKKIWLPTQMFKERLRARSNARDAALSMKYKGLDGVDQITILDLMQR